MLQDPKQSPLLRGCRVTPQTVAVPTEAASSGADPFAAWLPSESTRPRGRAGRVGGLAAAISPEEQAAEAQRAAEAAEAAEAEAAAILERAQAAADRLTVEVAREAAERETDAFSTAASQLLDLMQQSCARELSRLETEVAGLVADIAAKVVGRLVEADDEIVLSVVRAALEQAQPGRVVRVAVHPADEPRVRAAQDQLMAVLRSREPFVVVGDERVGPGGAIVETEAGTVDARLETQLDAVRRELEAEIGTQAEAA